MSQPELSGPDVAGVVADADAAGLPYVVIGGFSVIAHGYVRATMDTDLLVPDGSDADAALLRFLDLIDATTLGDAPELDPQRIAEVENLRVGSRHGIVDLLRGGVPPLDFGTVAGRALTIDWHGQAVRIASLASVVGFKRLARRPQDRVDLAELERLHGPLPIEPIPGLDGG